MPWDFLPLKDGFFTVEQKAQVDALFHVIHPGDPARGIAGAEQTRAADTIDNLLKTKPVFTRLEARGLRILAVSRVMQVACPLGLALPNMAEM